MYWDARCGGLVFVCEVDGLVMNGCRPTKWKPGRSAAAAGCSSEKLACGQRNSAALAHPLLCPRSLLLVFLAARTSLQSFALACAASRVRRLVSLGRLRALRGSLGASAQAPSARAPPECKGSDRRQRPIVSTARSLYRVVLQLTVCAKCEY